MDLKEELLNYYKGPFQISSLKIRKDLSVKEKHYVIYGIMLRKDFEYKNNKIIIPKEEEILRILTRYKIKHICKNNKIILNKIKERFFTNKFIIKDDKIIIKKFIIKRTHPIGLYLYLKDNYKIKDGKYILRLDNLDEKEILNLKERLNDMRIFSIINNKALEILEESNYKIENLLKFYIH